MFRETRCSSRVRTACRGIFCVASRVSSAISNFKKGCRIFLETLHRERDSSHDDGGRTSWFFSSCAGILELRWGTQGASRVEAGKSSLHSSCEGERSSHGIALESRQRNWASRRIEGGISRSFSSCSRKPWGPSTCDGNLRELLSVPMGSQEYCGVDSGFSGLHWVWCNGRGPHLELRREPQGFSPVLM